MESGVCVCLRLSVCMCERFSVHVRSWLLAVDASPQEEKDLFRCQTKSLKGQAKASDSQHHFAPHTHTQTHTSGVLCVAQINTGTQMNICLIFHLNAPLTSLLQESLSK